MDKHEELIQKIVRLEAKVDLLVQMVASNCDSREKSASVSSAVLERLTTKQHAALQMLLAGATNADIATRFEVSVNTAKVYVRSIASKLGANTRNQIVVRTFDAYQAIDPDEYRLLSGGLPKEWHASYEDPDPYKALYATKTR